jgi:hypothetical protein
MAGLVGPGADGVDDVAGRGMLVDGVVGGGGLHLVDGVDGVGERAEGWNADRVGSVAGGEILVDRLMGLMGLLWREACWSITENHTGQTLWYPGYGWYPNHFGGLWVVS